ncbi:hypothetical protein Ciccas_003981 [Cichlidogyrus casuarinus]|uniref:RRM domain-containing protein n=1 Tax=Cichlidogyrus casuarinus TaxID=1844966 RepID=A0ABD2QCU9_9PLAT
MVNYLVIYESEEEEPIEVPLEDDNSMLLRTITNLFPNCIGLKYKAETGLLRFLKIDDDKVLPPDEGWTDKKIYCVFPKKDQKRKLDQEAAEDLEESTSLCKQKRLEGKKCTDLIVLNLAWRTNEEDLRTHFSQFGDLVTAQIKRDPITQNSKGYGFIRFESYQSQLFCLAERHLIDGRWCDVKVPLSKREGDKQEVSRKIHVGRIKEHITVEQLRKKFEEFGRVIDVFVPKPFRSFAFVTFDDPDVASNLLGKEIEIEPGCVLLIGSAVPKLPPVNVTNQKQMAVAMHAAACVAALNQNHNSFNWPGTHFKPDDDIAQSSRYPIAQHSFPPVTANAAILAAHYTSTHRQHQHKPPNR